MTDYTNPYAGMTQAELEAAFTKEDPRYPARKKALEALHAHVDQWIEDYEFDNGEGGYHSPSEFERLLIADAFAGLTGDDEYRRMRDTWVALCRHGNAVAAAEALGATVLKVIGELMVNDPAADTPAGKALTMLADAAEAYERATLPPPLGNAGVAPTVTRLSEDEIHSHNWWCPHCHESVPPEMVTYDETHYLEGGGCGRPVRGEPADGVSGPDHQTFSQQTPTAGKTTP